MATKLQFKYGQFAQENGRQMSIDNPGLVVFNGKFQEIYVDGKTFGMSDESVQELLNRVSTLEQFREAMRVEAYAQAQIVVDSEHNSSELLIANIGQGRGEEGENDGKIFTSGNFSVKLDGVYSESGVLNPIATKSTVDTAVDNLRAEILGTIDPEELEKTLDTIKEIQDLLLNGSYTIKHDTGEVDPETGDPIKETLPTTKVVTTDPEDPDHIISIQYTDGDEENPTVYAHEDLTKEPGDPGRIVYEEGYSDLEQVAPINSLVANVGVEENKDNKFVIANRDEANVTIGVKYGTFKTGHGNVMDETSTAFVDGIATVADVQKYIEERMTWVSYEVSADSVASSINHTPGDTVTIGNSSNMPESLIIKGE